MNELYNIVKDRFDYDEKTGWLTWKNCKNGKRAGGLDKTYGYRHIKINKKVYKEHRIIWLWKYGYLPENQIDHINRIKDCNEISNLREVSRSCNNKNIGLRCNNKTRITGVFELKDGKYKVYIKDKNYKSIDLGYFNILLDAAKARYLGEVKYSYENCNSTSTALKYIKDNDPGWLNGEMKIERNKQLKAKKQSNVKGISFNKLNNKWRTYIFINKKEIHLGYFIDLIDAVKIRYKAEILYNKTKNSQAYSYLTERNLIN